MERQTHLVKNHKGNLLEVWLTIPPKAQYPLPTVVMCSGLGAEKADGLPKFAENFCNIGFATIMFDYSTFGGSEGQPRHTVIVTDQYQDYVSVINWAQQRSELDKSRFVAWGTSFGGMHVTRLLSERFDIAAGIAQCPCVDAFQASRMKPIVLSLQLTFWAILDTLGSYLGMQPIYVAIAVKNRQSGLGLMIGQEAFQGWTWLHPRGTEVDPHYNKICSRSTLSFPKNRPALLAGRITAPFLIVVGAEDFAIPRQAAIDVAMQAEKGELVEVDGNHFDVYEGRIGFEKNLNAQLEFLKREIIKQ